MEAKISSLTTWHPQLDNPNFLGWLVVACYLLAAACCGWVAVKAGKPASDGSGVWCVMAAVLLFLGINKQLNLQTLMIVLGRRAAFAGGWYEHRRFVQAVFSIAFALIGLVLLVTFAAYGRRFIAGNRLAFAGVVVLLLFVLLRAATINHAGQRNGIDLKDKEWTWVLELCGSILIAFSAVAAAKSTAFRDPGKS